MHRHVLYLKDIERSCEKISRFISGRTFDDFCGDEILFDAVVRNLQIVGEAVRSLPQEIRELRKEIEWSRIVGLRHLLVHHYFGIDEEIIWNLASEHVPVLLIVVREMLRELPES